MGNGIYAALSGAVANEKRVELLSHNLANVNTVGFHGFKMALQEAANPLDNKELSFAGTTEIVTDQTSGPVRSTGNPLDVALGENTYLAVRDGNKDGYVRGGRLLIGPGGVLQNDQGQQVLGGDEPLVVSAGVREIRFGVDGTVYADNEAVGKMKLVSFKKPENLKNMGERLIVDGGGAMPVAPTSTQPLLPGYLEMANVSAVKSMTNLISAHRNYNVTLNVIDTFSRMERKAATGLLP